MISSKPRLLMIDDEPNFVRSVSMSLEDAGFQVMVAHSGKEGLPLAYEQHPDLVILDISMPEMDGFQVLDYLRAVSDVPVIMLTALGFDTNRARGMDKGATDFLQKGVSNEALIAHIHARLRDHPKREKIQAPRRYGKLLEVDMLRHFVRVEGEAIRLTPIQWRLFKYLVEHESRIATYQNLLNAGWDDPLYGDPRAVKVQISAIRKKLHDPAHNSRFIHMIREEGYMFEVRA